MKTKKIDVEAAAKEWIEIKARLKAEEKRLAELKPILEQDLSRCENHCRELHGYRFTLVEFTQENFSLKKAKEKIDGRVLAPYITSSEVRQIRTSWQGGAELSEAA